MGALIHRFAPNEAKAAKDLFFAPYEVSLIETSLREYCEESNLSILVVLKMAKKLWPEETFDSEYMLNCYQSNQLSRSIALSI